VTPLALRRAAALVVILVAGAAFGAAEALRQRVVRAVRERVAVDDEKWRGRGR